VTYKCVDDIHIEGVYITND